MKKILYYIRLIIFIIYLIIMFLLIDKLYKSNFLTILYFILNIFHAIIIILTILSKKNIFKETISYNLLNIGLYVYTSIIYYIIFDATSIEILSNENYFYNNFIMLSILIVTLTFYTFLLNQEENKNDN